MADLDTILAFLEQQKEKQAKHFPTVRYDKVLSFMGTTSLAGTRATVGICPIRALEPAGSPQEMTVRLRGPLPRPPGRGECITVHVTNVAQFQGYQIKSRPVGPEPGPAGWEERGDELVVHGSQIFTVHHSPYTMRFFEQIPFEEVHQIVGHIPYALVGVGETANLSPRFIFHHEVQQGRLVLYHGDGLALKTYVNLKSNRQETRLVLDLDDLSGFALRATVEEFQPHQHPVAYDRICQGFTAGDWGKPSRTFRSTVEGWAPVAPTGPAQRG